MPTKIVSESAPSTKNGRTDGRRAPSSMLKPIPDAAVNAVIMGVGNAKPKATARAKQHSKTKKYSYKMPEYEHDALISLKEKFREQGIEVKKSMLVRAAVMALVGLSDARIKAVLTRLADEEARPKTKR